MRGATRSPSKISAFIRNFNPRAPCGARRAEPEDFPLCAENFNPRAPRGARPSETITPPPASNFNPRAPRGARLYSTPARILSARCHFNPRAPRGARPRSTRPRGECRFDFNPRAPRGARLARSGQSVMPVVFQSTRPARGATYCVRVLVGDGVISIHAPREGRDAVVSPLGKHLPDFNPRAPRGARPANSA